MKTRKFIAVDKNPIHCDCFAVIPSYGKPSGICVTPKRLNNVRISTLTYKDVNCEVCESKPCIHGICYTNDGKTTKCSCLSGYTGSLCDADINGIPKTSKFIIN